MNVVADVQPYIDQGGPKKHLVVTMVSEVGLYMPASHWPWRSRNKSGVALQYCRWCPASHGLRRSKNISRRLSIVAKVGLWVVTTTLNFKRNFIGNLIIRIIFYLPHHCQNGRRKNYIFLCVSIFFLGPNILTQPTSGLSLMTGCHVSLFSMKFIIMEAMFYSGCFTGGHKIQWRLHLFGSFYQMEVIF